MTIQTSDSDLFVVGGGINGAGIARDAAGRGGVAQRAHFGLWFSGGRVARQ